MGVTPMLGQQRQSDAPRGVAGRRIRKGATQPTHPTARPAFRLTITPTGRYVGDRVASGFAVLLSKRTPTAVALLGREAKLRPTQQNQGLSIADDRAVFDPKTGEIVGAMDGTRVCPLSDRQTARVERYRLLDVLNRAFRHVPLPGKVAERGKRAPVAWRFGDCHRTMISAHASVHRDVATSHAHFGQLQTCANPWLCPVCSARIAQHRATELRTGVNAALAHGWSVCMLTLTVPHTARDSIGDLVPRLGIALQKFWRGRDMDNYRKRVGIIGHVRSFEIKFSRTGNGWHPHFHILVFSRRPISHGGICIDRDWLSQRWIDSAKSAGLGEPDPEIGLTVQDGSAAGQYISKMGSDGEILNDYYGRPIRWDLSDEIAGGYKKNRDGGMTPFGLIAFYDELRRAGDTGASLVRQLLIEFAHAVRGLSPLRWSRGLRDALGLGTEKTDAEIMDEQSRAATVLALLVRSEWSAIVRGGHRPTVLALAEAGFDEMTAYVWELMGGGSLGYPLDSYRAAVLRRVAVAQGDPP